MDRTSVSDSDGVRPVFTEDLWKRVLSHVDVSLDDLMTLSATCTALRAAARSVIDMNPLYTLTHQSLIALHALTPTTLPTTSTILSQLLLSNPTTSDAILSTLYNTTLSSRIPPPLTAQLFRSVADACATSQSDASAAKDVVSRVRRGVAGRALAELTGCLARLKPSSAAAPAPAVAAAERAAGAVDVHERRRSERLASLVGSYTTLGWIPRAATGELMATLAHMAPRCSQPAARRVVVSCAMEVVESWGQEEWKKVLEGWKGEGWCGDEEMKILEGVDGKEQGK
ncbi:hypothetical protein HK101_002009, partial [Irineochytrium annulatum]